MEIFAPATCHEIAEADGEESHKREVEAVLVPILRNRFGRNYRIKPDF
jgi:hypothetical protein